MHIPQSGVTSCLADVHEVQEANDKSKFHRQIKISRDIAHRQRRFTFTIKFRRIYSFLWFQKCFSKFLIEISINDFKNQNADKTKTIKTWKWHRAEWIQPVLCVASARHVCSWETVDWVDILRTRRYYSSDVTVLAYTYILHSFIHSFYLLSE